MQLSNLLNILAFMAASGAITTTSSTPILQPRDSNTGITVPMSQPNFNSLDQLHSIRARFNRFQSSTSPKYLGTFEGDNSNTSSGSIQNTNAGSNDGVHYTAKFSFGDDKSAFNLALDTGSTDVYVRAEGCTAYPNSRSDSSCDGPQLSKSAAGISIVHDANGQNFTVDAAFGANNVATAGLIMTVYNGAITMDTNKIIQNLNFGLADHVTGFPNTSFDGILGLGFNSISRISQALQKSKLEDSTASFIDKLPSTYPRMFGMYLTQDQATDQSEFTVGGYDASKISGDIKYLNVASNEKFWAVDIQGATFSVGSDGTPSNFAGSFSKSLVDSGTPGILLDSDVAADINKQIGAKPIQGFYDHYQVDCKTYHGGNMPNITITISNNQFTITPQSYIQTFTDKTNPTNQFCLSLIAGAGHATGREGSFALLGVGFMRDYYSIFDKDGMKIGFGEAVHPLSPFNNVGKKIPRVSTSGATSGLRHVGGFGGVGGLVVLAFVGIMLL
ncbi:Vacuolar protease A [Blyttiomyces sp. JEL0837]|nr:Vacuolar protease A [Blyttiomyces sp. JEL0837]